MDVGSQDSVCELYHCVAQVDDCMAGERFDVAPLRFSSRWKDLKASKPIEEHSDTAEVGMFSQCHASVIDRLRGCFDEADLVATRAMQSM